MQIGNKIKRLRSICGLTQQELADRCDLTKGFISQLENDLNSPSIATLTDILNALGTNLKEFFADDDNEKIVFTKDDYVITDNTNSMITWLISNSQKNSMEPIMLELKPHSTLTKDSPHEGEEFGYVLKGKIILVLGNKQYKINAHESFYYNANRVHYLINDSNVNACVLWISSPPNF